VSGKQVSVSRSRSKIRRWHQFAEELLWGHAKKAYARIEDLPPHYWKIVDELEREQFEEGSFFHPSIEKAFKKGDAMAAALAARELVQWVTQLHAATTGYAGRARGGPAAAVARARNPLLTTRLGLSRLCAHERDKKITLTSKSPVEARRAAARATHQTLHNLNRILREREAPVRKRT
jgi:hypothetical protein